MKAIGTGVTGQEGFEVLALTSNMQRAQVEYSNSQTESLRLADFNLCTDWRVQQGRGELSTELPIGEVELGMRPGGERAVAACLQAPRNR